MYKYSKVKNSIKVLAIAVIAFSLWQVTLANEIEDSIERNYDKVQFKVSEGIEPLDFFSVYWNSRLIGSYNNIEYAKKAALRLSNTTIILNPLNKEVFTGYEQFLIYKDNRVIQNYPDFNDAYNYAKEVKDSFVIDSKENKLVYTNFDRSILWNDDTKAGDLFLVNKWNPINSEYTLDDFVNLTSKKSNYIQPRIDNMLLDTKSYEYLYHMAEDIYNDGITNMLITSTYRSYVTQSHLFNSRVNRLMEQQYDEETAINMTARIVAKPGTSEHQTGLAVDVTSIDEHGNIHPLNESFVNTQVGSWVRDNSWKYGYVVRYAEEKSDITGIIYEPWHLRFVGLPHAEVMLKLNFSLEEYLEYIALEKHFEFTDFKENNYTIMYFDSIYSKDLLSTLKKREELVSISSDGKSGVIVTLLNSKS